MQSARIYPDLVTRFGNEGTILVLPLQKTNWERFRKLYKNDWQYDKPTDQI